MMCLGYEVKGDMVDSWYVPMNPKLPADGWPRISREGIRILQQGMNHDFSEWYGEIGNHPLTFPRNEIRNVGISSDGEHFLVKIWHGIHSPAVGTRQLYCEYDITKLDFDQFHEEDSYVVYLRNDYWRCCIPILIEDAYVNTPGKTQYADERTAGEDEDDGEDFYYCTPQKEEKPKKTTTTLEAFL